MEWTHAVASACPAGGLHRAVPPQLSPASALRRGVVARDKARRLSGDRAQGWHAGEALQPTGQRPDRPLSAHCGGAEQAGPRSCIIDGEAVACGEDGISSFDRIRYRRHDAGVFLYAFDLIELNGDDLRRDPLAVRKATLASLLARAAPGLRFNEHMDEKDGPLIFAHACKMGLEGIVSKRRNSSYRSGRSPDWIKSKNPAAPAVKREAEEDWGSRPMRRR